MPSLYIHYGIGSSQAASGTLSERKDYAAGALVIIAPTPAGKYKFDFWTLSTSVQHPGPVSFMMPTIDENLYLFYTEITPPPPPPPPVPGDYEDHGPYLQSCRRLSKWFGSMRMWYVQDSKTGQISEGDSDFNDVIRTQAVQAYHCELEKTPPPPAPGGVTEGRVREIVQEVISGLHDLIDAILRRLSAAEAGIADIAGRVVSDIYANIGYHWTVLEDIVSRAEQEATAWRDAVAGFYDANIAPKVNDLYANLAYHWTQIEGIGKQISDIFTVEIPKLWTSLQEIVQHAEDEAKAWRAEVAGIWEKLDAWLVEKIVDIMLRGLDREAQK